MIPKIIHYIWLSDEPLNKVAKKCIDSWRKYAPGYRIVRWSMKDFDFSKMPHYVTEAIKEKKWAFASDYLRLYILYNEGGVYLDSDVLMVKSVDRMFNNSFVSSTEYYPDLFLKHAEKVNEQGIARTDYVIGLNIQAAVMASEPHHPFVKACLEYYTGRHFVNNDGSINDTIVAPQVISLIARDFGFKYLNQEQLLDEDIFIYSSETIAPGFKESSENSTMIHLCNGSWREMTKLERLLVRRGKLKQIHSLCASK